MNLSTSLPTKPSSSSHTWLLSCCRCHLFCRVVVSLLLYFSSPLRSTSRATYTIAHEHHSLIFHGIISRCRSNINFPTPRHPQNHYRRPHIRLPRNRNLVRSRNRGRRRKHLSLLHDPHRMLDHWRLQVLLVQIAHQ